MAAKPYVVQFPLTPVDVTRIDRMLDELYQLTKANPVFAGATGTTGATGATGASGSSSASTTIFLAGADGDDGADGQAIVGAVGPTGGTGAAGAVGPQGFMGVPGLDGEDGLDGHSVIGPTGPTGVTGPTGPTGASGSGSGAGSMGPPGMDGESFDDTSIDSGPGPAYTVSTWTPVLTAATPGDLSVTYASHVGSYTKIGNMIRADFYIETSAFTWTTASARLRITGLPFTSAATYSSVGALAIGGLTKAGFTSYCCVIDAGTAIINGFASGSGVASAYIQITDLPSGGVVVLQGTILYNV